MFHYSMLLDLDYKRAHWKSEGSPKQWKLKWLNEIYAQWDPTDLEKCKELSNKNKEITVLSTGIGTDNIDIVLNELDALANINLKTRRINAVKRKLTILRIGTSGAIQPDLPPGTFLASKYAVGFDGLLNYYSARGKISNPDIEEAFIKHTGWSHLLPAPYFCLSDPALFSAFKDIAREGITVSANGFYAPQGRELRAKLAFPDLNKLLEKFRYNELKITNFEMEGSAIYGLSGILGHKALTVCLIIANRAKKQFLQDYKPAMMNLVQDSLNILNLISEKKLQNPDNK